MIRFLPVALQGSSKVPLAHGAVGARVDRRLLGDGRGLSAWNLGRRRGIGSALLASEPPSSTSPVRNRPGTPRERQRRAYYVILRIVDLVTPAAPAAPAGRAGPAEATSGDGQSSTIIGYHARAGGRIRSSDLRPNSRVLQILVHELNSHRLFADRRGDALGRAGAHIAACEDAGIREAGGLTVA